MRYTVVAPYITVKTTGPQGTPQVVGLYRGATLPKDVPEAQLRHHLDTGLVVEDDDGSRA